MSSLWPWLMVAGMGALHGLNPCNGWPLLAACARAGDGRRWRGALLSLALGHVASMTWLAALATLGASVNRALLPAAAGVLLLAALGVWTARWRAPHAALASWGFIAAALQGSALMLVPALVPICLGAASRGRPTASGALLSALGLVAVHVAAMLAVSGVVALGVRRGLRVASAQRASRAGRAIRQAPSPGPAG